MIGAIIGDIAGSRFEGWSHPNCKSKDFELFHEDCKPTDDSIMTLAVASAMSEYEGNIDALQCFASASMKVFGRQYPNSTVEQRVNNIIYNYNRSTSNNNYKRTKFKNIIDGFHQTFFGVPTGYTPPIYTNPYYIDNGHRYGSYNDYYGNNGWRRYNSSAGTGSSIHIID